MAESDFSKLISWRNWQDK